MTNLKETIRWWKGASHEERIKFLESIGAYHAAHDTWYVCSNRNLREEKD